ncbi:hypothetical protein CMI37_36255 [Candidatus Pacearchaeota archaeon]|nr:hypothetical protein [Candidatus Pacearchaeota archaeon]
MIASMNKVMVMGRVESDADHRLVGDGTKGKLGFRLRTERQWKEQTFSTVHRIVAWGSMAEQHKSLKAGATVYVDGRLENRKYEKDGETKWISEISAGDIQVFGAPAASETLPEEEIPF